GTTESFEHDDHHRLTAYVDSSDYRYQITYNDDHLVQNVAEAGRRSWVYQYNAWGEIVRTVNPLGHERITSFDEHGNPVAEGDWKGQLAYAAFNALGQVVSAADRTGGTT